MIPIAYVVRPEAISAWHSLGGRLADLADQGRTTPCRTDPDPFTSEHARDQGQGVDTWDGQRGHPHPSVARLEEIHAAAGRPRLFKVWELDRVPDVERALAEEVAQ